MKRRLVNIGVFEPAICSGRLVRDDAQREIYAALKLAGFRETRWQFIYDGQTGGLVFPYRDGMNEIHVRFFDDRIFTELELSRSSILHFVLPLYNANAFLLRILDGRISTEAHGRLQALVCANLRDDEISQPAWSGEVHSNPYLTSEGQHLLWWSQFLHRTFNWRVVVGLVGISALVLLRGTAHAFIPLLLLALLTMSLVPTVGKP